MQKLVPALRIALLGSIGVLVVVIVLNLLVGSTDTVFQMMFPLISGLFAYGFLMGSNLAAPKCPACGTQQPAWRMPASPRQALLGGWTCATCGTELDRKGRPSGAGRA